MALVTTSLTSFSSVGSNPMYFSFWVSVSTEKLAKRHPRAAFKKELVRVLTPLKSRSTSSPWDSAVEDCWHKRVPSSGSTQTRPISSMTLIVCMVQLAPSQQLDRQFLVGRVAPGDCSPGAPADP